MKKSIHLLNQSLSAKIRRTCEGDFFCSMLLHRNRKRILRTTAALLFTGILSVFGLTAGSLRNVAEAAVPTPKFTEPSVSSQDFSYMAATEAQDSHSGNALEGSSAEYALSAMSSSADSESIYEDGSMAWTLSETAAPEMQTPDLDFLLSVVSKIPGGEEFSCSQTELLFSPPAETIRDILDAFEEEGRRIGFVLLDLHSGNYVSFDPDYSFYSASTMKGPYVAALNKFSPEAVDEYTESLMENTIGWSSNEDYETLHYLYGNDVMYDMTEYTSVSDSIVDDYNWYPYLTPKELTQLWIGTYFYFFEDTNENSNWCRSLYTDTAESFIGSALGEGHTVYTKAGWYSDWEDIARNDAGIIRAGGHDWILTIMSDAFESYDELEALAAALDEVRKLMPYGELEIAEAADFSKP